MQHMMYPIIYMQTADKHLLTSLDFSPYKFGEQFDGILPKV